MLVLWDHREPRGPELAGRLKSFKALDGVFPPMMWQIVFSGLRLVFFLRFICYAVPVPHILGVPSLEF